MIHPFAPDLSKLRDSELEEKMNELNKKYYIAYRLGNKELLTQVQTFVTLYREEMSKRYRDKLKEQDNGDLEQLINID